MISYIDKINISKALKIGAVLLYAVVVLRAGLTIIQGPDYGAMTLQHFAGFSFSLIIILIKGLFQPLILLGLAHLITIKQGK